jgi:hypothetical protein
MSFTQAYSKILSPFLKRFQEAENEKLRKSVLKNAAEAVVRSRDLLEDKGDLPKDLEKVLFILFCFFAVSMSFSPHFRPLAVTSKTPLAGNRPKRLWTPATPSQRN